MSFTSDNTINRIISLLWEIIWNVSFQFNLVNKFDIQKADLL